MQNYFLTTERLGFRHWQEGDLELATLLWGDPLVTRYFDARGQLSTDQVQTRLALEIETQRNHGFQYWPIFLRDDANLVGCCGLRPYGNNNGTLELGFHIRSDYWGRGFATEAAGAAIRHAFESMGATRLFAGHHPENLASRHLVEKLAFEYTHDEFYEPTSKQHACYLLEKARYLD